MIGDFSKVGAVMCSVSLCDRHGRGPVVQVGRLDEPFGEADVLVSTIPAAAHTPDLVAWSRGARVVFEVLYDPWPTPIARAAMDDARPLVGDAHPHDVADPLFIARHPNEFRAIAEELVSVGILQAHACPVCGD